MTRPAILITRKLPSSVLAKLEPVAEIDLYTGDAAMSPDELRARVADKDALMCLLTDAVDRVLVDAAPRLKVIANVAVGYNNIDVAHARSRGIVVTNTPDVLTESVADFTWALILAITRRLSEGERLVRSGQWNGWALDLLLGTEFDVRDAIGIAWRSLGERETRDLTYEFMKKNFDALVARMRSDESMHMLGLPDAYCDEAHRADAAAFFTERAKKIDGGPRELANTLEGVGLCIAREKRNQKSVEDFLKKL